MTTDKLPLVTPNPLEERLEALRELFPEAFKEGKLDLETFKQLLGEQIETGRERYGLSWAGKSEAIRAVQIPSSGTLRPRREQSLDFDSTENVIIEGDNLEVLKLLQQAYHGKVKLIYIDPPYNTGNDFVYPDDFREGVRQYLRFTGQLSEDGIRLTTAADEAGRVHSRWLSMMYPRLQLARSLLRDDGVIFVSIDDHELQNLRAIMDEIFGEENLIGVLIWHRRQRADNRNESNFSTDHEYLLCYGRTQNSKLRGREIDKSKYSNPDNDPRGPWASVDLSGLATKEQRPNLHYDIVDPKTGNVYPPNPNRGWSKSREKIEQMIAEGRIIFPTRPDGRPREKKFLAEIQKEETSFSSVLDSELVGYTTNGTREVTELFGGKVFDFPKPIALIKELISQATAPGDIVFDFFAGSGTTGHAVFAQNAEDGGNRKFILVQFPEPLAKLELELKTVADVTRARVQKAAERIKSGGKKLAVRLLEPDGQDLGFRAFSLDTSNFKLWDGESEDLQGQLEALVDNLVEGRSQEDVLFELLLKAGLPLSSKIQEQEIQGQKVYSVAEGQLLICLERPVEAETLRAMMALEPKPLQVVCLDVAFVGGDALKTNIVLEMRDRGIRFRTV